MFTGGIHVSSETVVRIFPNPAGELINFELVLHKNNWTEIEIISPDGRKIGKWIPTNELFSIPINNWSPGLYYTIIKLDNDNSIRLSFTKQ